MNRSIPLSRMFVCALTLLFSTSVVLAQSVPLTNWSSGKNLRIGTNTDISAQTPFVAVAPCRVVDTRNAAGPFGGPFFSAGQTRSFVIPSSPCTGIPAAVAYSLNFTLVNYDSTLGASGFVTAFPSGGTRPTVSTVNFGNGNNAVANAAIVPANGSGSIDVFSSGVTNLIIDINGYYAVGTISAPLSQHLWLYPNWVTEGFFVWNENTTSAVAPSVRGYMTATVDARSALMGDSAGATGITDAVRGINASSTGSSAGVHGISGTDMPTDRQAAGVRGASALSVGVLGQSQFLAISGVLYNSSNVFVAEGDVGYNNGATNYALFGFGNTGASGTKSFVEPDPNDASKVIRFVSLEGNEAGTYFRGRAKFDHGQAVISVPEAFRDVTEEDGLTVNVTPLGRIASVGVISADLNQIVVESTRDVDFSYIVYGVRRGFGDFKVIADGGEYTPRSADATMPGYLTENQKQRLIANGTYNADGSVNMATAVRLGWTKVWADKAAAAAKATPTFAPVPHE